MIKRKKSKRITVTITDKQIKDSAIVNLRYFLVQKYKNEINGLSINNIIRELVDESITKHIKSWIADNDRPLDIMMEDIAENIGPKLIEEKLTMEYLTSFVKVFKSKIEKALSDNEKIESDVKCYVESSFSILLEAQIQGLFDKMIQEKVTKSVYQVLENLRAQGILKID